MRGCVCPGGVPGDCLEFKDRPHFEVRVTMKRADRMVRSVWVRIYTQEAAANDTAPGPGFAKHPAAAAPRGIGINRRVSINTAYTTAYDDEFVYCGPKRFKNGGMA